LEKKTDKNATKREKKSHGKKKILQQKLIF
jgi:hypothetical protein